MDCCCASPETEIDRRSQKLIEKTISKAKKKKFYEVSLLLLGTGDSGKSTFMKQMKCINNEFTVDVRKSYIQSIYTNIFVSMQSMIKAMETFKVDYSYIPEIVNCVELIKEIDPQSANLSDENVIALKKLWDFEAIKKTFQRRNEYYISESTEFFLTNIDRIAMKNFLPTDEDIFTVRVQTNGIEEFQFESKPYIIRMIDIAGQRGARVKWFEMFEDCTAMFFLSAISEFDQFLVENKNVNRLRESLELFKSIINHYMFNSKASILFLNKYDLLEKKIEYSNLVDYLPEYDGPKNDALAAGNFIRNLFIEQKFDKSCGSIYSYFTCAKDTQQTEKIFKTVRTIIIKKNIESIQMS